MRSALIRLRANINLLMVMASVGMAIIGAWGEAAVDDMGIRPHYDFWRGAVT